MKIEHPVESKEEKKDAPRDKEKEKNKDSKDKEKGNPLLQIRTPDPNESTKKVYIRANPAGSRPHTRAKDGGPHFTNGGGNRTQRQWQTSTAGESSWAASGWKEGKGQWYNKNKGG